MKVAIIGNRYNPYNKDKITGGVEKVEHNQLQLFNMFGGDIHFITNLESEDVPYNNVKTWKTSYSRNSEKGIKIGSRTLKRERDKKIIDLLKYIQPDIIINHDNSNANLNYKISELNIPSLNFIHSCVNYAGGIAAFDYIESLYTLASKKHSVVCVSEFSRNEWYDKLLKSTKYVTKIPQEYYKSVDKIFTDIYHCPIMFDYNSNDMIYDEYIMIARPSRLKRIDIPAKLVKNFRLFTSTPANDEENKYLEELKKLTTNIEYNVPHNKIMDYLSKSKALLCCGDEAGPIVPFEAMQQSIPVIVYHRWNNKHPAFEMIRTDKYYCDHNKDFKRFLEAFTYDKQEYIKLAEHNYSNYYSPEKSYNRLIALIDKTIENFVFEENYNTLF